MPGARGYALRSWLLLARSLRSPPKRNLFFPRRAPAHIESEAPATPLTPDRPAGADRGPAHPRAGRALRNHTRRLPQAAQGRHVPLHHRIRAGRSDWHGPLHVPARRGGGWWRSGHARRGAAGHRTGGSPRPAHESTLGRGHHHHAARSDVGVSRHVHHRGPRSRGARRGTPYGGRSGAGRV